MPNRTVKRPCLPLKFNDNGPAVRALQCVLLAVGHPPDVIRGRYLTGTREGVRQLQKIFGLRQTGIFDWRLHEKLLLSGCNIFALAELVQETDPFYLSKKPPPKQDDGKAAADT